MNEANLIGDDLPEKLSELEGSLLDIVDAAGVAIEVANNKGEGFACSEELGHGISILVQLIKASQNVRHKLGQAN